MQVEPHAAPSVFVTAPGGGVSLDPGRQVVARVLEVSTNGSVRISLAGHSLTVQSNATLRPGDTLNLTVAGTHDGRVRLAITSQSPGLPTQASEQLTSFAPSAIRELARAGVAVTPQLAQAASRAIEQLASQPGGPSADAAARSIANLLARGLATGPATAGRVSAALELAGRLGGDLASLARVSPEIASALPGGSPTVAALRGVLAPGLSPAELALARIVQAGRAAELARAAAPSGVAGVASAPVSSPAVVANYVASQVASSTRLNQLAQQGTAQGLADLARQAGATAPPGTAGDGLAARAQAARLRGEAAAQLVAQLRAAAQAPPPPPAALAAAPTPAAQQNAAAAAPRVATGAAGAASAAAGPAAALTSPNVARVIADLSAAVTRFAPALVPGEGPAGQITAQNARQSTVGQQAPAGSYTPAAAGGGPGGAPAPLVVGLQQALGGSTTGAEQRGAQVLATMARYDSAQLTSALGQMGESASLRVAGALLDLVAARGASLPDHEANQLRHAIHNILGELGRALSPAAANEQSVLRAALELVAANDPRPAVAEQAARLLHAVDGQQLLSQPRAGADAGFVYFQLPLPGERSAEVLVRRDPSRRALSFDNFEIAFLLDTESLGALMIHLDAHPAAMRATIRTERPELEPFLAEQAEALRAAVEPEARRPVMVSTGVFDNGAAPASLLAEPALGLVPGENAWYG